MLLRVLAALLLATSALASSNDAAWRQDVAHLKSELPRLHKNAFAHVSKATFDAAADQLDADIPSLADHEVVVRMMQLVAMVGDAHTSLSGYAFTRFPFRVYWLADGVFVTHAASEHQDLLGARLVSIDGHAIDEIKSALTTVIPHENEPWLLQLLPSQLVIGEVLHALRLTSDPRTATFAFELADGGLVERTMTTLDTTPALIEKPSPPPLYRSDTATAYWWQYLALHQTAYIRVNRCQDHPQYPFLLMLGEISVAAETKTIVRVIVDLRDNPGGSTQVLQPLINNLQLQPGLNRADTFFVVINRGTASSAMINAWEFDQRTNATLIGEPTGGKPNAYGEVQHFLLPRSRLAVQYSMKFFELIPGQDPPSIDPHIPIALTSEDYFAGRDPVLESLLPQPRRRRSAGLR